ncbi:MAG: hypothetical protein LC118_11060, partial [Dehalococcoidia bacterium]|nr:hypothetical protein [Dehalococcoidia bacterium]
ARDGLDVEFVINERNGEAWVLNRRSGTVAPFEEAVADIGGVPTASPGVLAFYKATAYHGDTRYDRPYDEADFEALLPLLGNAERRRVAGWISAVNEDHPWLTRL